jgi:chromatin structure-remodeling complex subunit RSC9
MHQQAQHDGVIGNAPFPYFVQPSSTLPSIRQVQTPQTTPAAPTANNRPFGIGHQAAVNPNKIGGGHPGSNQMHRILMSLKCGMPDQVKWALAQLVCISYESGDELRADHWSGLCELLFNKLRSVSQLVKDYGHLDGLENPRFNEQLERINETALILRNMACIDNNARIFASAHDPKDIIVDGLRLMPLPKLNEFKNYLLDMTDSMAKYLPYLPDDPLLEILARNLESDDRGTLLVSIRSITRALFGRDDSNIIVRISPSSVRRMMSLLMLEDDELVSTCLDFFYHFTSLARNVELLLEPPDGSEFVRHLVRLLLFQGVTGEQLVYIKMFKKTRPPVHEIPQLSESIVRELIGFAEPERATKWFEFCPQSNIIL